MMNRNRILLRSQRLYLRLIGCNKADSRVPRRWLAIFLIMSVVSFTARPTLIHADTYGPEFRPGPFTPKGFRPSPGMDASGLDLSGAEFLGMSLAGANFSDCNLKGARFLQIMFGSQGANFRSANLTDVVFEEPDVYQNCDFTDATINGIRCSKIGGACVYNLLSVGQLRSTRSFSQRDLSRCLIGFKHSPASSTPRRQLRLDLSHFDVHGCTFVGANLMECEFRGANLTGTTFYDVEFNLNQLFDAINDHGRPRSYGMRVKARHGPHRLALGGLTFFAMPLRDWDLTEADLRETRFEHAIMTGAILDGARIQGCTIYRSMTVEQIRATNSYQTGDLSGITFGGYMISELDLSRKNLSNTIWRGWQFEKSDLTDSVITGANFGPSSRSPPSVEQLQSTWNFKHGRLEGIRLPSEHPLYIKNP